MSDPRDWRAGGDQPPQPGEPSRPVPPRPLPPHLDPRAPRGGQRAGQRPPQRPLPPRSDGRPPTKHGSPQGKVKRPRRARRILSWIAITLSVTILAVAGLGYALVMHYQGNITTLPSILSKHRPAAVNHAENFLLVGSDSRGDLKAGQGVQGTGATFVTGQRSDTVILAHLYGGNSDKVQLISFPRDSVVTIPAYTDDKGKAHASERQRINYAFSAGGPKLLIQTIEGLTGLGIDHYLQVDFNGFQAMVDKLGGVDVCLSQPAQDHYSGINLSAGKHHINGTVALSFVRQRHGLTNGDIDRIKRQQQFIGAMVRKVLSAGTLANPFKLNGFLDVATSSLQADDGLDFNTLRKLALRMHNIGAANVIFATVPLSNQNAYDPRLGSVVEIDQAKAGALFTQIKQDIAPGTPAPKATRSAAGGAPLIVRPGAIRVRVYNGSGVNGLGRKAFNDLTTLGFQTVGSAQTRGTGATGTVVRYGPAKADSARTLAAAIPGAQLQAAPELGDVLEVVVGSSYNGAKPVTIASTAPTAAAATPTPQVVTALSDPCAA